MAMDMTRQIAERKTIIEPYIAKGEHAGFRYLVAYNKLVIKCGCLYIPYNHVWYGVSHTALKSVTVAQGLTISVVSDDGNHWILGFDDYLPMHPMHYSTSYFIDQLKQLAEQAYVAVFL